MLKIRKVQKGDLDRLLAIINEPGILKYMPLEKPVKKKRIEKWYDSYIKFGQLDIFVLVTEKVIGACSLREDGKITIWIDEKEQRKGYGRQTIAWLKDRAKERGLQRLWLDCFKDNEKALAFYNAVGFSETESRGRNIVMEMKL